MSEQLPRNNAREIASQPRTIKQGGGRRWIHATLPKGKWQSLRNASTVTLLALFYATPWITIDGQPLIKLSFLSSSFVLFGNHILQYELFRFVLLALLLVISLFLASAMIGRAWCGYACPQTIFIERVLGYIETLVEGPASKRLANAGKPLTRGRILRKILKQFLYLLVSCSFAFTLVALFTGPWLILSGESQPSLLAVGVLTATAWFDGAYWREQFCHIACPYARFQNLMQDMQTRTIGYDAHRGEPRGRSKKKQQNGELGDCIDCEFCVRVCPSGIDIRQGSSQLECIACARCIDACDTIMTSLQRPKGLIRYDAIGAFETPKIQRQPLLRPRTLTYIALWCFFAGLGVWQFVRRDLHHVKLLNVKGALPYFQEGSRIKNLLSLKVGNQASVSDTFTVSIKDHSPEMNARIESPTTIGPIAPGEEKALPVLLAVDRSFVGQTLHLEVKSALTGKSLLVKKLIAGPTFNDSTAQ